MTQTRPENITIAIDKQGAMDWKTKLLSGQDGTVGDAARHRRQEPQPEVHIRGDGNASV